MKFEALTGPGLLGALPEAALVIDGDGVIVAGNALADAVLATPETPVGETIVTFLPEHERNRLDPLAWLRRWADRPEAPELAHVRLWCRARDGSDKALRVRVGALPTEPVCYLVMLADVTEEQARQYRTRAAHRLAARVLAICADGIVNVDESLRVSYANPAAERLFGYDAGELVGRPLAELLPERYRADHERYMRDFAGEASPSRLMGQRAAIRGLPRDGRELPLDASITKVTTDRGLVFCAILREAAPAPGQVA